MNQPTVSTEKLLEEIGRLRESLAAAQAQIQQLTQQNQQLQTELDVADTLEKQPGLDQMPALVDHETAALPTNPNYENLTHQLRKAAVISQKINTIREPESQARRRSPWTDDAPTAGHLANRLFGFGARQPAVA